MPADRVERVAVRLASVAGPYVDRVLRRAPVRRRLQRRALRAWRGTEAPLILCFGNVNRSPFAEALARRRGASRAVSAGFYPAAERPAPPRSVLEATRFGVDLAPHRSQCVDRRTLAQADVVFVFDLENLVRAAFLDRRALRRTHLIGALADGGPVVIEDPHGKPDAVLQQVFDRIAAAIDAGDRGR